MTGKTRVGSITRWLLQKLKPLWSVAIFMLVALFVWRQREDVNQALRQLRLSDWRWLVLLVMSAALMHSFAAQALSTIIARLGHRIPFIPALATRAEREMIATVMPFGGAASFITLVTRFRTYGVTQKDAMLAVLLFSVVGHLSFIVVAIPAMVLLLAHHNATRPILIAAMAVIASALLVLATVTALLRDRRFPAAIESLLPDSVREFRKAAHAAAIPARSLIAPFLLSLLADVFGVIIMWAALQAVRADASLLTALAAYTVATMIQLAAPVFQGLGIVEVSVIILLERLGVPLPQAIGATILYRFVDIWLPVVLGVGIHARQQPVLSGFPAYLPALWTALSGMLALMSVFPRRFMGQSVYLQRAGHYGLLHGDYARRTITLLAGFLLLVLAMRLIRRQHSAWVATLGISSVLTVVYLSRDFDDIGALVSGTNVVLLLIYRNRFRVRSDIPSLRRGLYLLAGSFSIAYVFSVLSLWFADKQYFGREFSIASSLRTATDLYLGFGDSELVPKTAHAEWVLDSMKWLGILSILISAFAILQPIVWRRTVLVGETARARRLIEQYGDSSLDRFKYWPDKHQFFSEDNKGVVSFGLSRRVALVLGDPTARDETAFEETLDEFLDFCGINGWHPAFHQTPATHLDSYRQRGFTAVMIGQDAIIHVDSFTLSGNANRSLRSVRNRAQREGRTVQFVEPPLSDELLAELKGVSDEWLTLEGRRERTFSLGQFEPEYVRQSPVLVVRSAGARAEAFINLIPDGAPGEMTLDLMRHRVDAPNGSMDQLILAIIDFAKTQGYTSVSLGMVPFVKLEPDEEEAVPDYLIARLARPMGRFFASESLFAYKNKFHPVWEPRYLVIRSVTQLPRVAFALTQLSELERPSPWHLAERHWTKRVPWRVGLIQHDHAS